MPPLQSSFTSSSFPFSTFTAHYSFLASGSVPLLLHYTFHYLLHFQFLFCINFPFRFMFCVHAFIGLCRCLSFTYSLFNFVFRHLSDDPCLGVVCPMGACRKGQCVCPSACRSDQPVCGSDGNTYPSRCHLKHHACASTNTNLTLSHTGPCREYLYYL